MKNIIYMILLVFATTTFLAGCSSKSGKKTTNNMETFEKGTYGFDKDFLSKYVKIVELKSGDASVLIVPEYQGRVMTSTCDGDKGFSFGWINYDLIEKQQVVEHINPFGGEERFWIGPEGGQFSIYFEKGKEFVFDNWFVPAELDTKPFDLVSSDTNSAKFEKPMELTNYSGTTFKLKVTRDVNLLTPDQIQNELGIAGEELSAVAYETLNTIQNTGTEAWEKETGLLSIWMLGMLIPSPEVTVVIPVKEGDEAKIGLQVNDNYFGKISADRLKVVDNKVFFKADGKSRGKIGIPPLRSTGIMGSYDAQNNILTILECVLPENVTDFVNSAWELQENPYSGDALNSYNDGPLEDGSQMGPFYELESSSPALALQPQEAYTHEQSTYHFKGNKEALDKVAQKVLGVSIDEIVNAF